MFFFFGVAIFMIHRVALRLPALQYALGALLVAIGVALLQAMRATDFSLGFLFAGGLLILAALEGTAAGDWARSVR